MYSKKRITALNEISNGEYIQWGKNISKFLSKWNENELHNGIQNALKLQVDEIRYNKT